MGVSVVRTKSGTALAAESTFAIYALFWPMFLNGFAEKMYADEGAPAAVHM